MSNEPDLLDDLPRGNSPLVGTLLVAMPSPAMGDPRFERSVIYICAHSEEGAMGLVINKPAENITFPQLLTQLKIETAAAPDQIRVHVGGPVDTTRGFVLHSSDYCVEPATVQVSDDVGLTATLDILQAIANGDGPSNSLLALGYAGWGPGQLEEELKTLGWLNCPADSRIVFGEDLELKWHNAMGLMGIDPGALICTQGTA